MSNEKFVRPRAFADGAVAVVRHPITGQKLPAEGALVDLTNIDVRTFFMRREKDGDVAIFASAAAAKAWDDEAPAREAAAKAAREAEEAAAKAAQQAATDSSAPSSTGSASPKSRKGADQ